MFIKIKGEMVLGKLGEKEKIKELKLNPKSTIPLFPPSP